MCECLNNKTGQPKRVFETLDAALVAGRRNSYKTAAYACQGGNLHHTSSLETGAPEVEGVQVKGLKLKGVEGDVIRYAAKMWQRGRKG